MFGRAWHPFKAPVAAPPEKHGLRDHNFTDQMIKKDCVRDQQDDASNDWGELLSRSLISDILHGSENITDELLVK